MKQARPFVVNALISGLITVVPIYLAVLLLLKAMASVLGLVSPFARLLPEWLPAENLLALLLLLVVCFVVGVAVRNLAWRGPVSAFRLVQLKRQASGALRARSDRQRRPIIVKREVRRLVGNQIDAGTLGDRIAIVIRARSFVDELHQPFVQQQLDGLVELGVVAVD